MTDVLGKCCPVLPAAGQEFVGRLDNYDKTMLCAL